MLKCKTLCTGQDGVSGSLSVGGGRLGRCFGSNTGTDRLPNVLHKKTSGVSAKLIFPLSIRGSVFLKRRRPKPLDVQFTFGVFALPLS